MADALAVVRWLLLINGVLGLLLSTVLFERVGRPLATGWWRLIVPPGERVPRFLLDPRVHQAWGAIGGTVSLLMWWYLGTPAGIARVEEMLRAFAAPR
jgi:hypothetical protein